MMYMTFLISNKRKECYSLVLSVYIKCGTIYSLLYSESGELQMISFKANSGACRAAKKRIFFSATRFKSNRTLQYSI